MKEIRGNTLKIEEEENSWKKIRGNSWMEIRGHPRKFVEGNSWTSKRNTWTPNNHSCWLPIRFLLAWMWNSWIGKVWKEKCRRPLLMIFVDQIRASAGKGYEGYRKRLDQRVRQIESVQDGRASPALRWSNDTGSDRWDPKISGICRGLIDGGSVWLRLIAVARLQRRLERRQRL